MNTYFNNTIKNILLKKNDQHNYLLMEIKENKKIFIKTHRNEKQQSETMLLENKILIFMNLYYIVTDSN